MRGEVRERRGRGEGEGRGEERGRGRVRGIKDTRRSQISWGDGQLNRVLAAWSWRGRAGGRDGGGDGGRDGSGDGSDAGGSGGRVEP